MANQFNQSNAFTTEPASIVVGSFVQWKKAEFKTDYPPSLYTLNMTARSEDRQSEIKLVSTEADDGNHYFSAASATTATWIAGQYHYQVEIQRTSDSERIFAYRGRFEIKADLDENAVDPRSHASKNLAAIEAVLNNRVTKDVSSYSIAGRSVTKIPFAELVEMRDYYRREVKQEENDEAIKNGKKSKATVRARFQ